MIVIAIPCWNQSIWTKMAIDSIKKNSGSHHIEFVLLDNGSSDNTLSYLRSLNPKVLIHNQSNFGVTKAWNQLLSASLELNPDVIALLNNDIYVCPGWLDPVVKECSKKDKRYFQGRSGIPKKDGTFFRNMPLGNLNLLNNSIAEIESDAIRLSNQLRGQTGTGGQGWSYFFRPEVVKQFLPIPEQFQLWYNDNYIYMKLEEAGYKQTLLLDCCIIHWGSASVCIYPGFNDQIARDKQEWIRMFGPFPAEYLTPAAIEFMSNKSKNPESTLLTTFSNPKPYQIFLHMIARNSGGLCLGITSDPLTVSCITSGIMSREDPKTWSFGICPNSSLNELNNKWNKLTILNSTPTDGFLINQIKGKSGSLNSRINLIYIDMEYDIINTILDCYKEAFSDNVVIVLNGRHHHKVNFEAVTNVNGAVDNPSWYDMTLNNLHPTNQIYVSIGKKRDFLHWSPKSGT